MFCVLFDDFIPFYPLTCVFLPIGASRFAGFSLNASNKPTSRGQAGPGKREINPEACHVPGFMMLQWLLPKHSQVPDVYFLLTALLLCQQPKEAPNQSQVS